IAGAGLVRIVLIKAGVHPALPADSVEYFGATADGKTASDGRAGAVAAGRAAVVVAGGAAPVAGAAPAAGAVEGNAEAPVPHSALRKSFHFIPFNAPESCAALYLALHSFIVSACAPEIGAATEIAPSVMTQRAAERTSMKPSLRIGSRVTHRH